MRNWILSPARLPISPQPRSMPTAGLKVTSITLAVKTYRAETIRRHIPTTGLLQETLLSKADSPSPVNAARRSQNCGPKKRSTGTTDSALRVGFVFRLVAYVSTSQHVGRWPTAANVTGSGLLEETRHFCRVPKPKPRKLSPTYCATSAFAVGTTQTLTSPWTSEWKCTLTV